MLSQSCRDDAKRCGFWSCDGRSGAVLRLSILKQRDFRSISLEGGGKNVVFTRERVFSGRAVGEEGRPGDPQDYVRGRIGALQPSSLLLSSLELNDTIVYEP